MPAEAAPGFELHDDPPLQEKLWRAQRVAWIVFSGIIIAALLGLTGNGGPLSQVRVEAAGVEVEHPRVARWRAEDRLKVRLMQAGAGETVITLDRAFLDLFEIEAIEPEPRNVVVSAVGVRLIFDKAQGGLVKIRMTPVRPQLLARPHIDVDGEPLELRMVILP